MDQYQDQQETHQLIADLYAENVRQIDMGNMRSRMESPEERGARIGRTKRELLAALAVRWSPESVAEREHIEEAIDFADRRAVEITALRAQQRAREIAP